MQKFVTVRELAELLKRSERAIYDDLAAGRIAGGYKINRALRVNLEEALASLRPARGATGRSRER